MMMRQRLCEILEVADYRDLTSRIFDIFLIGLIILNLVGVVLDSMPSVSTRYHEQLLLLQVLSMGIFTLEYGLRLWSCPEHPSGRYSRAISGRLHYMARPLMVADLVVLLAFWLPLPVVLDLRVLRTFRLLSILRVTHYSRTLQILIAVLKREWRTLLALLTLLVSLLLLTAWLMYLVERGAQPDAFGSIPQALWWGMATLTTVGYGDVVPLTTEGKFLGFLIMLIGIGMFAVPTGVLVATFIQEVKRKDFVATWNLVAHVPFFAGLTAQEIAAISDLLRLRTTVPGEVIFEKGDEGDAMYFIVSGEVELSFEPMTKVFRDGGFFGEMALLYKRPRDAAAMAKTFMELLQLEARDLDAFLETHPKLRDRITRVAEERRANDATRGDTSL